MMLFEAILRLVGVAGLISFVVTVIMMALLLVIGLLERSWNRWDKW